MFYRAYIFQNVNVSRFSKVKIKLKTFKGRYCLLSRVGLFPLEFLCHLKDSLKTVRFLHLGLSFPLRKEWGTENTDGVWPTFVSLQCPWWQWRINLRVNAIKITVVLSVWFLMGTLLPFLFLLKSLL